jgi:c-di-GMP-binding flagellar brake protein YcgR
VKERRRSHRFNLQGKVSLTLGDKVYDLPAADISVSGVGVMLDISIVGNKPGGEVGFCTIDSPDLACPVEAFVSVMRFRKMGGKYLLGLRFESISDEQLRVIQAYEALIKVRNKKQSTNSLKLN